MFGNGITAEAAEIAVTGIQQGDVLEGGDIIYRRIVSGGFDVYLDTQEQTVDSDSNNIYYVLPTGKKYEVEKIEEIMNGITTRIYKVYLNSILLPSTGDTGSNNSSNGNNNSGNNQVQSEEETTNQPSYYQSDAHTHSFSWVTVQEAGVGQDGLEEYRCSCGLVEGRNTIPGSQAIVSQFKDMIISAPAGEKISFDSGRFYTISDSIIQKLAQRNDVSAEITFEYKGKGYKMTIPAGADYTAILGDEENFYGYFYFAQLVGATIEEI